MKIKRKNLKVLLSTVLAITIFMLPFEIVVSGASGTSDALGDSDNPLALSGSGNADSPYLIQSSGDWDALSGHINSGGNKYEGKYFKLNDDITVTTVLGNRPNSSTDSNDNYFCGTFDGDGHTLNVNINESGFGAAPFAITHNSTIKNLHVTGTITSGANHATGLVAASKGRSIYDASSLTIQNVTVSADISCPSHIAGLIGHAHAANITMENVVFDGSLNASNIQGGMIGWGGLGNGATYSSSFKDCLFAGTYNTNAAFYPIAYANGQGTTTLVNDFYTTSFGSGGNPIAPTGAGQLKLLVATVEKDGNVKYFDNINTAADGSNWVAGSTLKVMSDVTTSSTITVPTGEHSIDLNGHGIKMTGSGSVINVGNEAKLSINDSNKDTEHRFTVSNEKSNGAGLATVNDTLTGEYKTFTGGYITGGNATNGGGIKVNGTADLTMNGGTIIGNQSSFMGAGIKADNNGDDANVNITVNGGAVIYNTVNGYGAGICSDGAVRINGGTIAYNVASNNPGGIHCHYLHISGGRVENNFAGATDYAAGAHADHEVFISGSPVINDNLVNGVASNLDWDRTEYRHGHKLILTDALTEGAKISVTMRVDGKGEFTGGWKANMGTADPSKYFTSDDDRYEVFLNGNGEAEIGTPPVASVINGDTTTNYGSLSDAVNAWTAGSTLKLLTDVTTSSTITVPSGEHTLDLNGCGIKMTGWGSVFYVGDGAKLIVDDSNTEAEHKFDIPDGAGLASLNEASGTYTVSGGYITGGSADNGGGIYIDEYGEVVMNGGALIGNHAEDNGAGIRMESYSSFTLNGGEIAYNQASVHGGGLGLAYTNHTTITVNDGEIHHNICECAGGAITLDNDPDSYLYLYGGAIRDNASVSGSGNNPWHPGGIAGNANVHIKGAAQVYNNTNLSGSNNGTARHNIEINTSENDLIVLDGPLSEGARIAVSYHTGGSKVTGVFTSGWSTYMGNDDPAKYFVSDYDDYIVSLSNGEAAISLPPVASVTSGETTANYISISEAVNAWTAGSTLKLLADVTTSSSITVPTGEHTLDLNGYGILMTGNARVLTINQNVSLELNDSDPDRIHYITLTDYRGTAVSDSGETSVSNGNGVIQVTGGYLTGGYINNSGSHDKCGAGVFNWGTFVMNGGSIVGNTIQNNSGAGVRNSGTFTMNDGTIAFNKATGNGGGVTTYVPGGGQGKMTMTGGEISDNYCGSYGGGIQLAGPFELTGGSVTRNTAGAGGSGIYYGGQGEKFKLSGDPVIKDNTNNNLYLNTDATFMINGSLTEDAEIGITMTKNAAFTVGWKDYMDEADPSKYFSSDDSNYAVIVNNSGELEINVPPVASIISGETKANYSTFSDAVNAWTAGSTLKLLDDVTTNSTITVPSGEHTLDLNGYTLKAGSAGYSVITVGSGADLTIDDTAEKDGKITGGSVGQNFGGGVTVDGGKLTLKGGAVSGNANTYNNIGNCGGGIHVKNSGKFYMEGGEISGNTSYVGGGVCSDASATTVSVTGGVIKNNTTERFGSAIWAGRTDNATFLIGGSAEIVGNISKWTSDKNGEASLNFSKLLISGDPTVHGDWKTSGTSSPNTHINLDNNGSSIQTIELDGELTNSTGTPKLTISPIYRWDDLSNGQTFVFNKNWNKYMGTAHPADYFNVDDSVSGVRIIRKNGEAAVTGSNDLGDLYITFDANEGKGTMEPQLATETKATLNANTFTREGYSFAGWNTKKDGSGTGYYDEAAIELSGDLTLYAQWDEEHTHDGTVFTPWYRTDSLPSKSGSYVLKKDITTTGTWTVPAGDTNICLNGHTIDADYDHRVIMVPDGATLRIYDEGDGVITGGVCDGLSEEKAGSAVRVEEGGSLEIHGGTITDNNSVSVFSLGSVKMTGGAIKNTKIDPSVNNVAAWGLEINGKSSSSFTMTGGEISGNVVGVNISVGTMTLSGGTICNNSGLFGGVFFNSTDAKLELSGDPVIKDNFAKGDTDANIWPYFNNKITIVGELTNKTPIGITMGSDGEEAGVFTEGWNSYMKDKEPSEYFTADNSDYAVITKDNEAALDYPAVPDVSASGHEGDYDGAAHGITVTAPEGAEIKYGTSEGSYTLTDNPTYTDAGTYTVYYEVSKAKHTSVTGSAQVKINKIDATVTVTGNNSTVDYDGKAHSVSGYEAKADTKLYDVTKDFTFSGKAEAEITNAGTAEMGLKSEQFENTNKNFNTVTFNVTDGYQKVDPIDVTVTVTGHNTIVDYNGQAHSADGYDASASSELYDVTKDFTFSGRATAVRTDAGTTNMGLSTDKFENKNSNFKTVTFDITDGYVKVEPINVTVTITGHNSTVDYDGKAHKVSGYDAETESTLYDVTKDFKFNAAAEAERTDAGKTDMGLSAGQFENINGNFKNVTFDVTDGYVKVDPIDVKVKITGHNGTVDYDGKAHKISGYDAEAESTLYDVTKDFSFSGKAEAERTDAGKTDMGLEADQFENTNSNFANVTFNITDGYVKVDPINVTVTITGNNSMYDYDGEAHEVIGYNAEADSELYDVNEDFFFSGDAEAERTDAGTTDMGLAASQFENINSNFKNVTFVINDGYVKVEPIDVTVTITGHNDTADYDGEAHKVSGYDAEADSELYDVTKDFKFSGKAEAERTEAGLTKMGLEAEQFENTNGNFANVTFNITDGYQKVGPIDVTVTITGHSSTVDYDGKAHKVSGYDAEADSELYDVTKDFKFSGKAEAELTDAGTVKMGLKAEQFENTNQNFKTVVFDVTDGYQKVDPIDVTVTITGHKTIVDYNGKAHSADGYDAKADSELYDVTKDFTFSGRATAVRTDAGTTNMALRADKFENTNSNFKTVTFDITDGYVQIDPIDVSVSITGHNSTVNYDGKAHSIEGYDAESGSTLYDVTKDFKFNATAKAVRTDAGKTDMGLKAEQFENTNGNFKTVTFNVTDGYQKIDPISVTVTITGHNATAKYDGKAHKVSGYDVDANSDLYDVSKDFTFSGKAEAERSSAGTTDMGLDANQFTNTNSNFTNVRFNITDGYQRINTVDAVITSAPHAKSKLVYNGGNQELIVAGAAAGGTLYYAVGTNDKTAPSDSQFKTAVPVAKNVGNYYIWYKVVADSNHNSISPAYLKVTLAEEKWVTVNGIIKSNDGKTPVNGATVTLMKGNTVVDEITSGSDGGYYFTVPSGVYNIVVKSNDITLTDIADITDGLKLDIVMHAANTDSVLDVASSGKSIVVGGLSDEADTIRAKENISADKNVSVKMKVTSVKESDTQNTTAIRDLAKDKYLEYYDLKVEKTIDSVTTSLDKTQNTLEMVIPCSFTNKRELTVYSCSGSEVTELTQSDSKEPGTFRVDNETGMIYVYSNQITTFAVGYKPYYSVKSSLVLGNFAGSVSVKLTKDDGSTVYELNDVSPNNISFKGVPKGIYSMTITWTDGAENTLTLPFTIN